MPSLPSTFSSAHFVPHTFVLLPLSVELSFALRASLAPPVMPFVSLCWSVEVSGNAAPPWAGCWTRWIWNIWSPSIPLYLPDATIIPASPFTGSPLEFYSVQMWADLLTAHMWADHCASRTFCALWAADHQLPASLPVCELDRPCFVIATLKYGKVNQSKK